MRLSIRNPKDFWSGILFLAVGSAAVLFGRTHPMGTAMRMGPAYFPTVLGSLLALIGLAVLLRALVRSGSPVGQFAFRKVVMVLGATALFGLLLRPMGLAGALAVLVVMSAYASQYFRWSVALALAAGLAVGSSIVFVKLLGLPIPILGSWFGG